MEKDEASLNQKKGETIYEYVCMYVCMYVWDSPKLGIHFVKCRGLLLPSCVTLVDM